MMAKMYILYKINNNLYNKIYNKKYNIIGGGKHDYKETRRNFGK